MDLKEAGGRRCPGRSSVVFKRIREENQVKQPKYYDPLFCLQSSSLRLHEPRRNPLGLLSADLSSTEVTSTCGIRPSCLNVGHMLGNIVSN